MSHSGTTVTVGDLAPSFALPTSRGEIRALADYLASGPVLIAFHRGIW